MGHPRGSSSAPTNPYQEIRYQQGEPSVKGENKEHWKELCAQAAVEQNPERLMVLIKQITGMLEEKERRLLRERSAKGL